MACLIHILRLRPLLIGQVLQTFRNCWKISGTQRIQSNMSAAQRLKRDQ